VYEVKPVDREYRSGETNIKQENTGDDTVVKQE